jgi:hypothetical protein
VLGLQVHLAAFCWLSEQVNLQGDGDQEKYLSKGLNFKVKEFRLLLCRALSKRCIGVAL